MSNNFNFIFLTYLEFKNDLVKYGFNQAENNITDELLEQIFRALKREYGTKYTNFNNDIKFKNAFFKYFSDVSFKYSQSFANFKRLANNSVNFSKNPAQDEKLNSNDYQNQNVNNASLITINQLINSFVNEFYNLFDWSALNNSFNDLEPSDTDAFNDGDIATITNFSGYESVADVLNFLNAEKTFNTASDSKHLGKINYANISPYVSLKNTDNGKEIYLTYDTNSEISEMGQTHINESLEIIKRNSFNFELETGNIYYSSTDGDFNILFDFNFIKSKNIGSIGTGEINFTEFGTLITSFTENDNTYQTNLRLDAAVSLNYENHLTNSGDSLILLEGQLLKRHYNVLGTPDLIDEPIATLKDIPDLTGGGYAGRTIGELFTEHPEYFDLDVDGNTYRQISTCPFYYFKENTILLADGITYGGSNMEYLVRTADTLHDNIVIAYAMPRKSPNPFYTTDYNITYKQQLDNFISIKEVK